MRYKAMLVKDGERTIITTASKKHRGSWMIGGDFACASRDLGFKIFIYDTSTEKLYLLKGSRLVFQDYVDQSHMIDGGAGGNT